MRDMPEPADERATPQWLGRRALLAGVGLGAAVVATGCSDQDEEASPTPSATPSSSTPTGDEGGTGSDVLVPVADVPEGGGVILSAEKVVVTQPEPGTFRAFSAVCTHQGCVVTVVSGSAIGCGCHGSQFALDDGSVLQGPATAPLPEIAVTVDDGQVMRA